MDRQGTAWQLSSLHTCKLEAVVQSRAVFLETSFSQSPVGLVDLHAYAVTPCLQCSQGGGSCSTEWVEDGVSNKREHSNQSIRKVEWEWRRVFFRRRAANLPCLSEPLVVFFFCHLAEPALLVRRLPITSRFPLHQNELYVILDDSVRLVWLSEEARTILDLKRRVGDLVPDDGIQIVEPDSAAIDGDVCVEWDDDMPSEASPGQTHVADNTYDSAPRHQHTKALLPHFA